MIETAYAKINLALHVRGRAPDGYHALETLFAFAEDGDRLTVHPSPVVSLAIEGPFARGLSAGEDNLVMRAARALAARHRIDAGARLTLDKRLPVAAGIGGGSADAAATLRLLSRFWGLRVGREDLHAMAAGLGADVPACLASQTVRGAGRGDVLRPADAAWLGGVPILLVNPGSAVSTAAVFARWGGVDRGVLGGCDPATIAEARNDLEAPARSLAPEIGMVLDHLRRTDGAMLVRMSGSGATCFALYRAAEACAAAAASIARAKPDWWRLVSRLR